MNILLLDADGTQALPLALSLNKKKYNVYAFCRSKLSYGYNSRFIKKRIISFNPLTEETEYLNHLIEFAKDNTVNTIIPLTDYTAEFLSKFQDKIKCYCTYILPTYEIFMNGFNKNNLMRICESKGYPHPRTYHLPNTVDACKSIEIDPNDFPLLIKPNITCGARGMTYVASQKELEEKYPLIYKEYGECHLQQFIPSGGNQVEVQLYINEDKELVQSSVIKKYRWYPENGGSSCCNVSCLNPKIVDICYSILKDLDWVGFADFDTIENPLTGELLIMEINPRLPACIKSAFVAGVDWADILINEYLHKPHRTYQVKEGFWLRHLGFEILWFMYSKNRFKTKPSWFNFFGKGIYYQDMSSFSDPMPFIKGTFGNVIKQLSPKFRKAKSGTR